MDDLKLELSNETNILFREITSKDTEAFLEFRAQVPHDSTHTMQYVGMKLPSVEKAKESLQSQENDDSVFNLGAFDSEKMIGYLNLRKPYPKHPWVPHLAQFGMMILKDYWGFGIGRKFLELQEVQAKKIGVVRIEAMVRTENPRGVNLYTKAGYDIEGTRRKAALINNVFHDEYFIAKILDCRK